MESFTKIVDGLADNYLYKTLHLRYLKEFWICLWKCFEVNLCSFTKLLIKYPCFCKTLWSGNSRKFSFFSYITSRELFSLEYLQMFTFPLPSLPFVNWFVCIFYFMEIQFGKFDIPKTVKWFLLNVTQFLQIPFKSHWQL